MFWVSDTDTNQSAKNNNYSDIKKNELIVS